MPPKNQNKVKIKWSENFAYAIGLIVSDGSLHKDKRHIRFTSKDLELIRKFKTALNIKNKPTVCYNTERSRKWLVVNFGDKIFYEFLERIGLMHRKSKIIKSVLVPDAYFADFLRGVFDGDGTFYSYYDTRWPNSFCYKLSIASASKNFALWLKRNNARLYGTKGFFHKGDGVINLEYVKGDSEKIFRGMYYDGCELFLTRKYAKIKNALDKNKKIQQQTKPR